MREILFRGKRVDNGEWVHGDLKQNGATFGKRCFITRWLKPLIEVVPETVGQYTGLTDKNGTKIFEGDIVIRSCCPSIKEEVLYSETYMGWHVAELGSDEMLELSKYKDGEFEVIGNIHDNPELLGVE